MSLFFWIAVFTLFALGTTFLLKKFTKAETHLVVSLVRSTRFLPLLDKPLFLGKWIEYLAKTGLVLGFGAVAVDYLFMKNKSTAKRITAFVLSTVLLTIFFNSFLSFFFRNPFVEEYVWVMALSFGIMGFAGAVLSSLASYSIFIIESIASGQPACPGVAPLIPGVEIPKVPLVVPLHGWISLFLILIIHEASHGTVARYFKTRIKSSGLLLIGLLPIGAFVEPDEKQLKSLSGEKEAMVYAAGPTANLLAMLAVMILAVAFFFAAYSPFVQPWEKANMEKVLDKIVVKEVDEKIELCGREYESPAFGKIEQGWVLIESNGKKLSPAEPVYMESEKDNNLVFITQSGERRETSIKPNELGAIGFKVERTKKQGMNYSTEFSSYIAVLGFILEFLNWFVILNLLLALVNFLPTEPFDGGKIAKIVLLPYFGWLKMPKKDTEKLIGRLFSWLILALLVLNALPLFI